MFYRYTICAFVALLSWSCKVADDKIDFDRLSRDYVKLGLEIGQYDPDFVDAYYGPDSLKPAPATKSDTFPKNDFLSRIETLRKDIEKVSATINDDTLKMRSRWMVRQLSAFDRRIRWFAGEHVSFDEESRDIFATEAPVYPEEHYRKLISQLNEILPGKGNVADRMQVVFDKFNIPEQKIDTVFKVALAEARKITRERFSLPAGESFTIEYVRDKPWSGYNWYKGNYKSVIQINLDHPINISRAIDLACHEGYPGHHVYNLLLEKNIYHDKGWIEISLYPLFSPQSLIAEGTANYGIEVAFPETKFKEFTKNTLLPLAGLDTTGFEAFYKASAIRKKLNFARNEVARGIANKTMTPEDVERWQTEYQFVKRDRVASSLQFIEKYRSYVICYNHGEAIVDQYMKRNNPSGNEDKKWEIFEWMLSNPISPPDIEEK